MTKHPRALAILVVLAGLLVPASPAFAVGTPTITTPATTPSYTTNQVDLAWSTVLDATNGYEVYRGSKAALNMFMRSFAARHRNDARTCFSIQSRSWTRPGTGSRFRWRTP